MFRIGLFPNSTPMRTIKVIGEVISIAEDNFSDSISYHIEMLYAMAQPWLIKSPLIKCYGNIGSPEKQNFLYSGASSPSYTEILLTEEGVDYIEKNSLQTFSLSF